MINLKEYGIDLNDLKDMLRMSPEEFEDKYQKKQCCPPYLIRTINAQSVMHEIIINLIGCARSADAESIRLLVEFLEHSTSSRGRYTHVDEPDPEPDYRSV